MSRKTARVLSVVWAVIVVIMACICKFTENEYGTYILLIVALPVGFYLARCQRCRHCGRWPRKGDYWEEYCPGCGKKHDEEEG